VKKQYRKVRGYRKYDADWFYYNHISGGYYRQISTFQEQRRNNNDLADEEFRALRVKVRRRRAGNKLNAWNLERFPCRAYRRTWKDFTRHARQWGVGEDPGPQPGRRNRVAYRRGDPA
jgi:hypothetical protein